MGKDTVSNQNRTIATRATKHKATTLGATDMCYAPVETPDKAAPFANYIPTEAKLDPGTNTSQKTLINNNRIWIDEGRVGAPGGSDSKDPHPPKTLGQKTKIPYRKEAWNTSCSGDVVAEGKGVVRTDDTTKQNKANTDGKVDGSEVEVTRELTEQFYKNACVIKSLTGKCGDQQLGKEKPASKVSNYLQIYNGETVEFTVVRVDKTKSPEVENPTCQLESDHAHWRAQRTYESQVVEAKPGKGDTYKIDKAITDVGLEIAGISVGSKVGIPSEANAGNLGGGAGATTGIGASATVVPPDQFVRFFRCQKAPPRVLVRSTACGGPVHAFIFIKPKGAIKFSVTFENEGTRAEKGGPPAKTDIAAFSTLLEKIRKFKEICDKIKALEKVSKPAKMLQGKRKPIEYNFLTGVTFEIGCEYKRCTRSGRDFTPAHIRRSWWFKVEGKLFEVKAAIDVPLDTFAGSFIGGPAGAAVAKAMNRAGISIVYATFTAGFSASTAGTIGLDQHGSVAGAATGFTGKVTVSFEAKITVDLYLAEFSIAFTVEVSGQVVFRPPDKPGIAMFYTRQFAFGSTLTLTGRAWIFERSVSFDGPAMESDPTRHEIPLPG